MAYTEVDLSEFTREKKLEALVKEANDYMFHAGDCPASLSTCTCGLSDWYKKAKEVLG